MFYKVQKQSKLIQDIWSQDHSCLQEGRNGSGGKMAKKRIWNLATFYFLILSSGYGGIIVYTRKEMPFLFINHGLLRSIFISIFYYFVWIKLINLLTWKFQID